MFSADPRTRDVKSFETEIEAALNPAEAEGTYRDSRECAALLLFSGTLLLSPPAPHPKKS